MSTSGSFTIIFFTCILIVNACSPTTYRAATPKGNTLMDVADIGPPPGEPGKCYAKAQLPSKKEVYVDTVGIYNLDAEIPASKLDSVLVRPASKKWVKKRADKNCLSANPDDCLVWCLQETPALYLKPSVVEEEDRKLVLATSEEPIKVGGQLSWVEVLCHGQFTTSLKKQLKKSLFDLGYDPGNLESKQFGAPAKAAITKFQTENDLPVGQLDMETLTALGIK